MENFGSLCMFGSLAVLIVGGFLISRAAHIRERGQAWRALAADLGLTCRWGLFDKRMEGRYRDRDLLVEARQVEDGELTLLTMTGLPPTLTLHREQRGLLDALLGTSDLETGDRRFDRAVYVSGHTSELRAMLDAPTRALLTDNMGLKLRGGTLRLTAHGWDVRVVSDLLRRAIEISEAVDVPEATRPHRLARIAGGDDFSAVRANALRTLVSSHPGPVADKAARRALQDAAREVRAVAALALEDVDTLRQLFGDPSLAVADRAAMLHILVAHGLHAPLLDALQDAAADVRVAALALIATRQIGALGDQPVEGLVRPLLDDPATAVSAIRALQAVGTAASIPALSELGGRAARTAIRTIQARIGPDQAGTLSLADDGTAGALSVAKPPIPDKSG